MSQLYPHLAMQTKNGRTLVATCVGGELHELAARTVADFFEMAGWNTYYLGASTPVTAVVEALVERKADMLAVSTTMTYSLSEARRLIDAVRARPECARTPIILGPVPSQRSRTCGGLWVLTARGAMRVKRCWLPSAS